MFINFLFLQTVLHEWDVRDSSPFLSRSGGPYNNIVFSSGILFNNKKKIEQVPNINVIKPMKRSVFVILAFILLKQSRGVNLTQLHTAAAERRNVSHLQIIRYCRYRCCKKYIYLGCTLPRQPINVQISLSLPLIVCIYKFIL